MRFFVIPQEKGGWTVIFNKKQPNNGGAFDYKESADALRVTVTPKQIPLKERMVYVITKGGFSMEWDKTSVPVSIK